MRGTNLGGATLVAANFSEAVMQHANLSQSKLMGANFYKSQLQRADLTDANLSRANLEGANLSNAILPESLSPQSASLLTAMDEAPQPALSTERLPKKIPPMVRQLRLLGRAQRR